MKRHKEGVIGLVLPEPLRSLARRFVTHGELGDLWKAPNGHGPFEVLEVDPEEMLAPRSVIGIRMTRFDPCQS